MENKLYGREISQAEWNDETNLPIQAVKTPAIKKQDGKWQCQRCGTTAPTKFIQGPCTCGENCFYCIACLNMAKLKKCTQLYYLPEINAFEQLTASPLAWQGELSKEQTRASQEIIQTYLNKESRLIWAVAGSGKTEMMFQGIAHCLMEQGRVCIASPRIDVCLELAPRIQAAFPTIKIALLYGGSEEYTYTPLVIATTHQLLRFKQAFDLLIIDEVDSFPYHNDLALQFGAEKARKVGGALLYLTATPPGYMQKQIESGQLAATILPARYHGYPLPEIKTKWLGDWRKAIRKRVKKSLLIQTLASQLSRQRKCICFLPHIDLMLALEKWLQELYPTVKIMSVSAEDAERIAKIKAMRAGEVDFLLTTTILERGVTFIDIDVLVIGAEDSIFTESSLVQIAGRVGRHQNFPTGLVLFGHFGKTKAINNAIKQVKMMNQHAARAGLLNELPLM